jgi:hypothetical protein
MSRLMVTAARELKNCSCVYKQTNKQTKSNYSMISPTVWKFCNTLVSKKHFFFLKKIIKTTKWVSNKKLPGLNISCIVTYYPTLPHSHYWFHRLQGTELWLGQCFFAMKNCSMTYIKLKASVSPHMNKTYWCLLLM